MDTSEHPVLAAILSAIEREGKCEVSLSELGDTVFKRKSKDDWDTKAQILIWAVSQKILYEYVEKGDEINVLFYKNSAF